MPYITQKRQSELREKISGIVDHDTTKGELNYLITVLVGEYVIKGGLRYDNINDVMGALQGCFMEFYSRVAAPYEALKAKLNGDVHVYHVLDGIVDSMKD